MSETIALVAIRLNNHSIYQRQKVRSATLRLELVHSTLYLRILLVPIATVVQVHHSRINQAATISPKIKRYASKEASETKIIRL